MAEQILASHSQVYGAGELYELDRIIRKTLMQESDQHFLEALTRLRPDTFRKIGAEYVSFIRNYDRDAMRIVDKMPHNFMWIGLIRIALPEAKIIHCKRDPMDTCWSIYKNIFDVPHKYAQDLIELGQYCKLYLDLMGHWKQLLGDKIFDLEYEQLIQNQEHETRRLLDFCDLSWEDGCLDFHKADRRVHTSSLSQVRQPIYSSSVKKWKYFEKELRPLIEILLK
jgi:hypothetical protein